VRVLKTLNELRLREHLEEDIKAEWAASANDPRLDLRLKDELILVYKMFERLQRAAG
jgi:hypothetical protein